MSENNYNLNISLPGQQYCLGSNRINAYFVCYILENCFMPICKAEFLSKPLYILLITNISTIKL